jgi:CRISPR-associated exonuclease Cas4
LDTEFYLPISRINQFIYCPRRFWLVFIEGGMQIDAQMLEGILHHRNVHVQKSSDSSITGLPVASERLRIAGVIDLIEPVPGGMRIVEHKRGSARQWVNDQLQIAAQAIAIEEMTGVRVVEGSVFSWSRRRRYIFEISPAVRDEVEHTVQAMFALIKAGRRPPPTIETQRCKGCSLLESCHPALIRRISKVKTGASV